MSFIEKYLVEPFKYIESDWFKVLIGSLLLFLYIVFDMGLRILLGPFAIIFTPVAYLLVIIILIIDLLISIIISGYYIGVIKNTLKGVGTLPNWSNLIEIVKDGILYNIALLILLTVAFIPVVILLIVGAFFTTVGFGDYLTLLLESSAQGASGVALIFLGIAGILSILIMLILIIYIPLAMVNFARKGFLGFFEFFDILKKISFEYILILLLYIILFAIISAIFVVAFFFSAVIILIPFIGVLISGLIMLIATAIATVLSFIVGIMFNRAVAKYYLEMS